MFIAFIIIVILLGGFVLLLRQAGRAAHPLLQSLRSRGIRPGAAELLLCSRPSFVSAGRLMTEREQRFLRRLDRVTDTRHWRLLIFCFTKHSPFFQCVLLRTSFVSFPFL